MQLNTIQEQSHDSILFCLAPDPAGKEIFAGAADARIHRLSLADPSQSSASQPSAAWSGHTSYVTGVTWAGNQLVSGGYDRKLIWWDTDTGTPARTVPAHAKWIRRVIATPDGRYVISIADDMACRIWDAQRAELVRDLRGHAPQTPHDFPSMLYAVAVSPDGRWLATGDRVGRNVIWDLHNGRQVATLETPKLYTWDPVKRIHSIGGVRSLAFSSDSRLLAVGGMGAVDNIDHLGGWSRVEVFDWQSGKRTLEFVSDTYKGLVECLAFDPKQRWLLAGGGDHNGFLQFLRLDRPEVLQHAKAPMHVHDFKLTAGTGRIQAVGHRKAACWEVAS